MSNVVMQLEQPDVIIVPTSSDIKSSKWGVVKAAHRRILPRASKGELKLSNLIDELQKFAIENQEDDRDNEQIPVTNCWNCMKFVRGRIAHFLQKSAFHYFVISLVIIDLIVVLVDLVLGMFHNNTKKKEFNPIKSYIFHLGQLSAPCLTEEEMEQYNTTEQRETCLLEHSIHLHRSDVFLFYFSVLLLSLFVIEVFLSFYAFGWKYYKNPLYLLDGTIVLASFVMELYFHYGSIGRAGRAASAIIILRLWKIIRAIHAVAHSITLKNRLLIKKIQEAKLLLEEEKEQTEQTLEKQEIKLDYFVNILTTMGKLPSTKQIDNYIKYIQLQRQKPS